MLTNERVKAPPLASPSGWLNTDRPLRIGQELTGQVVLLDFWTYCCINCMHILPDLKYLEHKYRDEPFVVIGVHSAKFANEGSRQTIRSAIHRYEIEHPVIVDDGMRIWRSYGARSWPTFILIDPEGYVVGSAAGEGNRDLLDEAIGRLLSRHRSAGTLASGPLAVRHDGEVEPATGLAFPGKVLADDEQNRVFIADSNHNRIVVTTWPDDAGWCRVIKTIGSGEVGCSDGPADRATFNHPQGMTLQGETLYVADTESHAIRAVDLTDWSVRTVVGTGEMSYDRAGGAIGGRQPISSPWDLASEGGTLYIAMAGIHQIWRAEMPAGFARALAGSGRENIVDGPVETAALSQPSGICLHAGKLYFADSEVSAVRGVDLATERVFTVIGEALFVFGDVDGVHPEARLQHPLGITSWGDKLLVADTYNHKIKLVEPGARRATTLLGTGQPGAATDDGGLALYEPGGLDVRGDELLIADTNNHRVVHVNLTTRRWAELRIDGLSAPQMREADQRDVIDAPPATVAADSPTELNLTVSLPTGAHLNAEAPWTIRVSSNGKLLTQQTGHGGRFPLTVSVSDDDVAVDAVWDVSLSLVYCTDDGGSLCVPQRLEWRLPIKRAADGRRTVPLEATVGSSESRV